MTQRQTFGPSARTVARLVRDEIQFVEDDALARLRLIDEYFPHFAYLDVLGGVLLWRAVVPPTEGWA